MKKMFWIDLEMTGLDEKTDHILEVAVVITNLDFEVLASYDQVIYQSPEILGNMNDWCKKHHGESGLTQLVPHGKPLKEVERDLISLADQHYKSEEKIVLCGNSVGNDQRFVLAHWPEFAKRLHYRVVDVSSFKEIFRSKYNVNFQKSEKHRAVGDILASIEELKKYLTHVKVEA